MRNIFIWSPKIMLIMCTALIWNCLSSCCKCMCNILGVVGAKLEVVVWGQFIGLISVWLGLLGFLVQTRSYGEQFSEREFEKLCQGEEDEDMASPKKPEGRGRPRKLKSDIDEQFSEREFERLCQAEEDEDLMPPRRTPGSQGRGRPRKVKPEAEEHLSEREFEKLCQAEEKEKPLSKKPGSGQGRGRPRKVRPDSEELLKPTTSPATKQPSWDHFVQYS